MDGVNFISAPCIGMGQFYLFQHPVYEWANFISAPIIWMQNFIWAPGISMGQFYLSTRYIDEAIWFEHLVYGWDNFSWAPGKWMGKKWFEHPVYECGNFIGAPNIWIGQFYLSTRYMVGQFYWSTRFMDGNNFIWAPNIWMGHTADHWQTNCNKNHPLAKNCDFSLFEIENKNRAMWRSYFYWFVTSSKISGKSMHRFPRKTVTHKIQKWWF